MKTQIQVRLALSFCAGVLLSTLLTAQEKGISVRETKATDYVGEQRYALVVGINDYEHSKIPDLKNCENDAKEIYKVLTDPNIGGVRKENATLLIGKDADLNSVKRGLNDLRKIPSDSTVFVYYSGHGSKEAGEAFWVTQDAEPGDFAVTALPDSDIRKFLDRIPSKRVVVMIDACYASATVDPDNKNILDLNPVLKQFTGQGQAILSAAGDGEEAIEAADLKHSVFTYHLLAGLKGAADANADGIIVLPELTTYIDNRVADEARKRDGIQKPVVDLKKVQEPAKFKLVIDADRIVENLKMTALEKQTRERRLSKLKDLFLDEKLTREQAVEAVELLSKSKDQLSKVDLKIRDVYISLAEGELAPEKLERALAFADLTRSSKKKLITNSIGMEFALIPRGTFLMGSPKDEEDRYDNESQHKRDLDERLLLGNSRSDAGTMEISDG